MHKITSTIIGIAIATILTAYNSALTMSNQVFAQPGQIPPGGGGNGGGINVPNGSVSSGMLLGQPASNSGRLGEDITHSPFSAQSNTGGGLGDPGEHTLSTPIGPWKLATQLAGHAAQLGKILGSSGYPYPCFTPFDIRC